MTVLTKTCLFSTNYQKVVRKNFISFTRKSENCQKQDIYEITVIGGRNFMIGTFQVSENYQKSLKSKLLSFIYWTKTFFLRKHLRNKIECSILVTPTIGFSRRYVCAKRPRLSKNKKGLITRDFVNLLIAFTSWINNLKH